LRVMDHRMEYNEDPRAENSTNQGEPK
jgi:hypothetical protein